MWALLMLTYAWHIHKSPVTMHIGEWEDALICVCELNSPISLISSPGKSIALQRKLLETECRGVKPDSEFLSSLADVVDSKWLYLATLLSFTSSEIREVRAEGKGLSQRDHALLMLGKWASSDEASYGQLFETLKPVSLFQLCS